MTNTATALPAEDILDDKPQEVKADLRKFNKAEDQVNKAVAACSTIKDLKSQSDVDSAIDIMKKAKQVETIIENKRKDLVKPFNDAVKRINDYAKTLTGKIAPAIQEGKDEVLAWQKAEELRKLNERTENRKAQLTALGFIASDVSFENDGYVIQLTLLEKIDEGWWADEISAYHNHVKKQHEEKLKSLQADLDGAGFFGDDEETSSIQEQINDLKSTPPPAPTFIPAFGSGSASKVKGLTKTWTHEVTDISQVPREYLVVDTAKVTQAIRDGVRSIPGINIFQKEGITLR